MVRRGSFSESSSDVGGDDRGVEPDHEPPPSPRLDAEEESALAAALAESSLEAGAPLQLLVEPVQVVPDTILGALALLWQVVLASLVRTLCHGFWVAPHSLRSSEETPAAGGAAAGQPASEGGSSSSHEPLPSAPSAEEVARVARQAADETRDLVRTQALQQAYRAQEARHAEWAYAVWQIPEATELIGVHGGGSRAWSAIRRHLAHGRYSFAAGHRLRRFASVDEAIEGWYLERERHHIVLREPFLFNW